MIRDPHPVSYVVSCLLTVALCIVLFALFGVVVRQPRVEAQACASRGLERYSNGYAVLCKAPDGSLYAMPRED